MENLDVSLSVAYLQRIVILASLRMMTYQLAFSATVNYFRFILKTLGFSLLLISFGVVYAGNGEIWRKVFNRAKAWPESIDARARPTPSFKSPTLPATNKAAAAFSKTASR